MRQVFSSARPENVKAVARLLADAGIEVKVEDGERYRRSIRGSASYRDSPSGGARASVWVLRSDDQARARQLLRDAGLLEAGATTTPGSFLPATGHAARAGQPRRRTHLTLWLMLAAAVALAMYLNRYRNPGWELPARPPAAGATAAIDPSLQQIDTVADSVHRIPVPPALAAALASAALADAGASQICLAVDGAEVEAAALAGAAELAAAVDCAARDALRVSVADYRTDGSGAGTVEVTVVRGGVPGEPRRLAVRRDGDQWQVPAAP